MRTACSVFGVWLAAGLVAGWSAAQTPQPEDIPPEFENVGVTEQLGVQLPLDLVFVDDQNRDVRLRDLFDGKRPVLLTLNFFRCTSICDTQLNGLVAALQEMSWVPGREFRIITLSFDPLEESSLARGKKQGYMQLYGRPEAAAGWHFLTGKKAAIKAVTSAVGFRYRWDESSQQWAHSSAAIFCSPDGKVCRYLGGVLFEPQIVRLSLVEASEGKVGSLWDQVFLTCFRYESSNGRYVPFAKGMMKLGGGVTLAAVAGLLLVLWRVEARRRNEMSRMRAGPAGG